MESMTTDDMDVVDDEQLASLQPPPPPVQHPKRPRQPRQQNGETAVQTSMGVKDANNIREMFESLGADAVVKARISRKAPRVGPQGENISGSLEVVDDRFDEDYIREVWGGGEFSVQVQTMQPNGQYRIFGTRSFKIAGNPKMHGRELGNVPLVAPIAVEDPMALRAFDSMQQREREAREDARAARLEGGRSNGLDMSTLSALTGPLNDQLSQAQQTIRELQSQMLLISNKPPARDEFRDQLMGKMLDGGNAQVETLRATYESRIEGQRERYEARLDKLIESHEDAIKRLEDRHVDDMKRLESRHERELKMLDKQSEVGNGTTKIAYDARLDAAKETIARLERELTATGTKIATLEAKKDQTISEKADELLKVQEALEGLGGGSDKEEKWYEKIIGLVGNSEAAIKLINNMTGGPPVEGAAQDPNQAQQQQLPQPGVPYQVAGDPNIYVRDAAGNTSIVDQSAVRRGLVNARKKKRAAAAAAAAVPGAEPAEEADAELDDIADDVPPAAAVPQGRPPDAKEIAIAIAFMENSIKNNTPAAGFGATARNLMPSDVLEYLMGFEKVDDFLAKVKLGAGSPLATIKGRVFARQVHKFLRDGTTE